MSEGRFAAPLAPTSRGLSVLPYPHFSPVILLCGSWICHVVVAVGSLKPSYSQRQPQVLHREGGSNGRCTIEDAIKVYVVPFSWGHLWLLQVCTQTVACPKWWISLEKVYISSLLGFTKTVVLSVYIEVRKHTPFPHSLLIIPSSISLSNRRWRESISMMNKKKESGSHCHIPLPCRIAFPGIPLRKIFEVEVDNIIIIQLRYLYGVSLYFIGGRGGSPIYLSRRP